MIDSGAFVASKQKRLFMFYRQSWSIQTINSWPKRVFSWLFTFSFTPTCTLKRNSGMCKHTHTETKQHPSIINIPHELQCLTCVTSVTSCRVDTEEWMATVEVLLSKSSEACKWMVQYVVGPEGREITRLVLLTSCFTHRAVTNVINTMRAQEKECRMNFCIT